MISFINSFFYEHYNMSEILLNKFEKEKRVIELHLEGKTIRDIAKEVHMSFKDIGRIIKAYEKQQLELKKKPKSDSSRINKNYQKIVKLLSYFVMVKNLLMLQLN